MESNSPRSRQGEPVFPKDLQPRPYACVKGQGRVPFAGLKQGGTAKQKLSPLIGWELFLFGLPGKGVVAWNRTLET